MTPTQKSLLKQLAQMGDLTIVKQNGARINVDENLKPRLKTQFDAVLYFFQRMDIEMLTMILDDDREYQDLEKKVFLKKLAIAFEDFQAHGNTFLNIYNGKCVGCNCSEQKYSGISFLGNKSNHYMNVLFEIENDKILDIFECADFERDLNTFVKGRRIQIDKYEEIISFLKYIDGFDNDDLPF